MPKIICSQCHKVTLKTFDSSVSSLPEIHHLNTCQEWCEIRIACEIAYNNFKDNGIKPHFQFKTQYESTLRSLQKKIRH